MRLFSPEGRDTRPITDRVKESVFNILYTKGYLENRIVADLFCGTGSMGLEALSRGAKWATFVDKERRVIEILKRNIEKADFIAQSKAVSGNIFRIGAPPTPECGLYDLVFVDPPYVMSNECGPTSQVGKLMALLSEQMLPGGLAILRTHERAVIQSAYAELTQVDQRNWGTMTVTFYCKGQLDPKLQNAEEYEELADESDLLEDDPSALPTESDEGDQ
jgi:16S rRNA (guanine966-N2)-methyltransferase